jgi:LDH2 family malate/lactate/ureidoglycolate dehydrogenase
MEGDLMANLDPGDMERFCRDALTAEGCAPHAAEVTARGILFADLHGFDTHGVANLERVYLIKLRSGEIDGRAQPRRVIDLHGVGLIDARRAVGYLAATQAMDLAIEKARQFGIGAVGVRNSTHCGCIGQYTSRAVEAGMIGIGFTNLGSQAILPPPNGRCPMVGTNVIAAAAPAGELPHFDLDMSAAVVSTGRIRAAHRKKEALPPGWLIDQCGQAVTDPAAFLDGTAFLQFLGGQPVTGAYKGYGLAILIDILCGMLTGGPVGANRFNLTGKKQHDQGIGHFFIVLNISAFRPLAEYQAAIDEMLDCLVSCPAQPGSAPVAYPGMPQRAIADERRRNGIPLDTALHQELLATAERLGVLPPRSTTSVLAGSNAGASFSEVSYAS